SGEEDECKRRREYGELWSPQREGGEQAECGEARVRAQLGRRRALHALSSAGGVGTESSASRTRSSPLTRCTQSSGRSVRRCASAGTATAFTSSGVTKSRALSAARQRDSLSSASDPRGDAPTCVDGAVRAAVTTSTT